VAAERTVRWLERCKAAHGRADEQALFGIIQGGTDLEMRTRCVTDICSIDLPGYAIEVAYEGLYELALDTLADGTSTLLDDHFGALGGWIAATLVKLGDLRLGFLPADDE